MFRIEDKIQESKEILAMQSMDLQNEWVAIVVPSLDKSGCSIHLEDRALFDKQRKNSDILARYIMENTDAESVCVTKLDGLENSINNSPKPYCVIFLDEFMYFEKNMILEKLAECTADLKHVEIC